MIKIATLVGCAIGNPYESIMSIALATSLIDKSGFDFEDVSKAYLSWMKSDEINTKSVARASVIGLYYRDDISKCIECAMADASITYNSLEHKIGSVAVALGTALLVNRDVIPRDVSYQVSDILANSEVKDKILLTQKWLEQGTDLSTIASEALAEIGKSGYVPEAVAAAFFCLGATNNFMDAVVLANKSDGTIAAIIGSMAGTYYGIEGLSEEYKDIENFELLQGLTDELVNNET